MSRNNGENRISQTPPQILAIDTSCDETSVAILQGRRVLSNVVSSQTELHKKWGGVVPDVARRAHIEDLPGAFKEALKRAKLTVEDLDAIAATQGPGLAIDLEIGLQFAKELAIENNKPFIPINHMAGHMLSGLLLNSQGKGRSEGVELNDLFPFLGMLISGKHTEIILVTDWNEYEKLGKTLDDAAGEAFDKFGRMMGYGYPGGPIVSDFAKKGGENELINLPIPMERSGDMNFSYSGLKTACLYRTKELREKGIPEKEWAYDMCYAFVESITRSIELKLKMALNANPDVKAILTGGGVLKNEKISRMIGAVAKEYEIGYYLPETKYRGDNAAMIGLVAVYYFLNEEIILDEDEINEIDRVPRMGLDD